MNNKKKIFNMVIVLLLLTSLIPIAIATDCNDCDKENSFFSPIKNFFDSYFSIASGGFTVISITTDPYIISSNDDLRDVKFIVNTIFNSGGQQIVGYILPEEFEQKSGYETDYTLDIIAKQNTEYVTYEIDNYNPQKIYEYSYTYNNPEQECGINMIYDVKDETNIGWSGYYHYCFYKTDIALKGEFNEPYVHFNAPIRVCAGGECIEKTITDAASSSGGVVDFNNGNNELVVQAKWVGSLVTGKPVADEDEFVPILVGINKPWKSIDREKYDDYKNEKSTVESKLLDLDNLLLQVVCEGSDCTDEVREYVDNILAPVNNEATNIIRSNDPIGGNYDYEIINGNTLYKTDIQTDNNWGGSTNPMVTFLINAHWIGVKIPVCIPEIINVNSVEIASGNRDTLEITVKNIGTEDGTISASLINNCPLSVEGIQTINLDEDEIGIVKLFLSTGNVNEGSEGTCTVRVQDVNLASNYDTATFEYKTLVAHSCAPNEYYGESNCIYKCRADGTKLDEIECCGDGKVLKNNGNPNINNGWYCYVSTDPTPTPDPSECYVDCVKNECGFKDTLCELNCQMSCWWEENKFAIYLILVIIVLIFIILLLIKIGIL